MTLRDIDDLYNEMIMTAKENRKDRKKEWLKDRSLDGKVIRKSDNKVGCLDLDWYGKINFYPMKKDGTRSLNASGICLEPDIEKDYEPYKEGGNIYDRKNGKN